MSEKTQEQTRDEITELVAHLVHKQWCHWMSHMMKCGRWSMDYGEYILEGVAAARWKQQMVTPYPHLTPGEKDSDRKIAAYLVEALEQGGYLAIAPPQPKAGLQLDATPLREKFLEKLAELEEAEHALNFGKNYGSNSGVT